MFRIQSKEGWGLVIVAEHALLPGTVIFNDKAVVKFEGTFDGLSAPTFFPMYSQFKKTVSEEDQAKLLAQLVQGPCYGECSIKSQVEKHARDRSQTDQEFAERLLRFTGVLRQKAFETAAFSKSLVFGTAGLLYPSCDPNCYLLISGDGKCVCRAATFIAEGEVLTGTFSLDVATMHAPTRGAFLRPRGFTCHCSRCDAVCDDTRLFSCSDSKCGGRHYAHQPRELYESWGVEHAKYAEPYLLPCTVCQRSPPLEFQSAMFAQEAHVAANLPVVQMMSAFKTASAPLLDDLRLLPHHSLGHAVCVLELAWRMEQLDEGLGSATAHRARLMQLATDTESAFANTTRFTQNTAYDIQIMAIQAYNKLNAPLRALVLGRRLLRLHRIRQGRDVQVPDPHTADSIQGEPRNWDIEEQLNLALTKLCAAGRRPSAPEEGCCVFCEESPERAAMKRSRCGACKKVVYCGAACQTAHWKVHKAECRQ
jgi:hypothetical protein